jgi:hypothetical protein
MAVRASTSSNRTDRSTTTPLETGAPIRGAPVPCAPCIGSKPARHRRRPARRTPHRPGSRADTAAPAQTPVRVRALSLTPRPGRPRQPSATTGCTSYPVVQTNVTGAIEQQLRADLSSGSRTESDHWGQSRRGPTAGVALSLPTPSGGTRQAATAIACASRQRARRTHRYCRTNGAWTRSRLT